MIGLRTLPYFFPAKPLKGKKEILTPKRSTKAVAAPNFLPIFATAEEAFDFFKENTLQTPRIHLIGDIKEFNSLIAVVTLETRTFTFKNFKKGFIFCFACFFALDLHYPNLTSSFWVLVQQIAFNIYLESDRNCEVSRNISLRKEILIEKQLKMHQIVTQDSGNGNLYSLHDLQNEI